MRICQNLSEKLQIFIEKKIIPYYTDKLTVLIVVTLETVPYRNL